MYNYNENEIKVTFSYSVIISAVYNLYLSKVVKLLFQEGVLK